MKSDFVFVLIALGTLECVTWALPTSSEIQQDSGDDHTSIQEDLLAFLNQVADLQQDYGDDNTESAEAEIFRKAVKKVKGFVGLPGRRGPTYPGGAVPAPEFTYIPGGSPVKPDSGQGYSRGRGGGKYPRADPRHPEDPPRYPGGSPPQYNDQSSNEEEILESELSQIANGKPRVVPFRRESFIKNPDKWKLKPNYKRGFFDSIWEFFKNLYQMANR